MPIYALYILSLLLIVHVVRTGRNTYWIYILIFAPLLGALAYLIVELLPDLNSNRSVRRANRAILDTVNPNRDIRLHSEALDVADTIENTLNLAQALKERGLFDDALALYNKAQTGVYKDDPYILLGKADVLFQKADFSEAKKTLDELIEKNPNFKSPEGHLLYAKSLEGIGEEAKALHEYEALNQYYAGPEPKCHYARLLKAAGETEKANALFQEIVTASKRSGRHYNFLHKEWINIAKQSLKN